jgi:signal transduction histidine kinase
MRDRLDAVGGTVEVVSRERTGTTVTAVIPRTDEAADAHRSLPLRHQVA